MHDHTCSAKSHAIKSPTRSAQKDKEKGYTMMSKIKSWANTLYLDYRINDDYENSVNLYDKINIDKKRRIKIVVQVVHDNRTLS